MCEPSARAFPRPEVPSPFPGCVKAANSSGQRDTSQRPIFVSAIPTSHISTHNQHMIATLSCFFLLPRHILFLLEFLGYGPNTPPPLFPPKNAEPPTHVSVGISPSWGGDSSVGGDHTYIFTPPFFAKLDRANFSREHPLPKYQMRSTSITGPLCGAPRGRPGPVLRDGGRGSGRQCHPLIPRAAIGGPHGALYFYSHRWHVSGCLPQVQIRLCFNSPIFARTKKSVTLNFVPQIQGYSFVHQQCDKSNILFIITCQKKYLVSCSSIKDDLFFPGTLTRLHCFRVPAPHVTPDHPDPLPRGGPLPLHRRFAGGPAAV